MLAGTADATLGLTKNGTTLLGDIVHGERRRLGGLRQPDPTVGRRRWTPAEINSGNFGFILQASNSSGGTLTKSLDGHRITVYYTGGLATVSLDRAVSYSLREMVGISRVASYGIAGSTGLSRAVSYEVRNAVGTLASGLLCDLERDAGRALAGGRLRGRRQYRNRPELLVTSSRASR